MQRLGPAPGQLRLPARAHLVGCGRAQVELRERSAQVQPGAADDDRAGVLGEQAVDLRMGELGVLADREARVDGQDRDQPVVQARPLGERRDAGQRLEALVDLQRVGGHRDRPLAARAQAVGDGKGERRLADAGRPEDRQHAKARKRPRCRSIVRRVSVRIGCGLSTGPDPRLAAIEAGQQAHAALGGARADVVCVFASGAHLAAPEATLEGVHEALAPPVLIGCGAGGVVGDGREVERGTAVAVWAAALGDGRAEAFHLDVTQGPDAIAVGGMPELDEATAVVLLPDPYSFPTDLVLGELARRGPGVPVLGGIASARTLDGNAALFLGDRLCERRRRRPRLHGRRGDAVRLAGRGARRPRADGHGGRRPRHPRAGRATGARHAARGDRGPGSTPAGARLQRAAARDRHRRRQARVRAGRLPRARRDRRRPRGGHADRRRAGPGGHGGAPARARRRLGRSRPARGAVACGARRWAAACRPGRSSSPATGAARRCSGRPDHDAITLDEELAGAPAAGFFAAGEIGPVGGDPFLHGFTATVAVFPP